MECQFSKAVNLFKPLTMKGEYWNKDILQCYIGHINVADVKLKNA